MTRSKNILKGVTLLGALVALLGGVPALLAATVGWPLPRQVPKLHVVLHAWAAGPSPHGRG